MAARARGIEIPLRIRPDSSIQRSLRGVTRAARIATGQELAEAKRSAEARRRAEEKVAAAKEQATRRALAMQMRAMEKTKAATERSVKAAQSAAKRRADAEIREAERSAKAQQRAEERTFRWRLRVMRESQRMHERTERARVREAQKAHREMERSERNAAKRRREIVGTIGGGVVGGVVGGAHAALGYAQSAKGRLGVQDHGDTLQTAKQIQENLIRQMSAAGASREDITSTVQRVDATARTHTIPQSEIAEGIAEGQSRFSDLEGVMANLDVFAKAARASGESFKSIASFGLTLKQVGRLTDAEVADQIRGMFIQSAEGAIEVPDFAGTFAPSIATFAQNVGASGAEEMSQITALAQVLGKSLKSADEVSTVMERFGARLKLQDTQKKLKKVGIDIANEKTGEIDVSTGELVRILATNEKMKNPVVRQAIFSDLLGESGAATIVNALDKDPMLFHRVSNADPSQGDALMGEVIKRLDETPFSEIDKMNIEAQSVTLMNKGGYVDTQLKAAQTLHEQQVTNPVASELVGPMAQTVAATGIGAGLGNLVTRGTAGAWGKGASLAKSVGSRGIGLAGTAGRSLASGAIRGAGALMAMGPLGWAGAAAIGLPALTYALLGDKAAEWGGSLAGPDMPRVTSRSFGPVGSAPQPNMVATPTTTGPAPTVDGIAASIASQVKIGKGEILIRVEGPGKVIGTKQEDTLPRLNTGRM